MAQGNVFFGWDKGKKWPLNWSTQAGFERYTYRAVGSTIDLVAWSHQLSRLMVCIGAIDDTHVTAKVPATMSAAFCGRKHYTCQNVLAVVNFDLRKIRYHLNEFSARNQPQNAKELFILRHSSLRVTIERVFAALKNRFKVHTFETQVKLVLSCCILHN
ncbi:uncharacterized protein [Lolium perenne]|uniref:uncharacterized protein n=1 Tax=Lolium perenne TaxID=4522 RepID=UPI003A99A053